MEGELLMELWSRLKPLIPKKDRLDAADQLIAIFDEHGMVSEADKMAVEFDTELKAAFVSVYGIEEGDEYD